MTPLRCRLGLHNRWEPIGTLRVTDPDGCSWVKFQHEVCAGCGAERKVVIDDEICPSFSDYGYP